MLRLELTLAAGRKKQQSTVASASAFAPTGEADSADGNPAKPRGDARFANDKDKDRGASGKTTTSTSTVRERLLAEDMVAVRAEQLVNALSAPRGDSLSALAISRETMATRGQYLPPLAGGALQQGGTGRGRWRCRGRAGDDIHVACVRDGGIIVGDGHRRSLAAHFFDFTAARSFPRLSLLLPLHALFLPPALLAAALALAATIDSDGGMYPPLGQNFDDGPGDLVIGSAAHFGVEGRALQYVLISEGGA